MYLKCVQFEESQIDFAGYFHRLHFLICCEMNGWTTKLKDAGQRYRGFGNVFQQKPSKFRFGETPFRQVKISYLIFLSPLSEEEETVEIYMMYDRQWKPVITICSTRVDPIRIPSTGNFEDDLALIKEHALKCFAASGLNFR
jgi:hypothetical protein